MLFGLNLALTGRGIKGAGGGSLLGQATSQLGGVAPYHYWDFINNRALFAQADVGGVASTPGWSFARASTGYAETAAGVLVPFASGELRRTDKGVLIEGARTNLCVRSQELDNASWSKVNASVGSNVLTAPDGTATADKLIASSAAGAQHRLDQTPTSTTTTQVFSVYAKQGEYNWISLRVGTSGNSFNLATGALGVSNVSATASIRALANGWYLCSVVVSATANDVCRINLEPNDGIGGIFTGDNASGAYFWGAQLEAAAFPSSYIPTTTASATRAADVLTVSSPGTDYPLGLFAEFEPAVLPNAASGMIEMRATSQDRAVLTLNTTSLVQMYVNSGNVDQANETIAGAVAVGSSYKSAMRSAANDMRHVRNGTLGALDTSATLPATATTVVLGAQNGNGTATLFGYLKRAAIFNFAPSDAQLQAMTT